MNLIALIEQNGLEVVNTVPADLAIKTLKDYADIMSDMGLKEKAILAMNVADKLAGITYSDDM